MNLIIKYHKDFSLNKFVKSIDTLVNNIDYQYIISIKYFGIDSKSFMFCGL